MQTWLDVRGLKKNVDGFGLGPIDYTIEPGTITALIGNNGSGKSTLLKMLMNLVKPDTGSIELFNKKIGGQDETWKKDVAYQAQTPIGYDVFTGEALKDLISHWYPNWDDALFASMVRQFDVPLTKRFGTLSQGAQQKLILALTIPRNAKLLILDEPTSFLDIPSKNMLIDLLVDWMDQDERSIIIASHQSEAIKKLADYIMVLNRGKLIGTFEKEQLIESYQRFWYSEKLPASPIPGEIVRDGNSIVSEQPKAAELFLIENQMSWTKRTAVDLDEIITILLERK